MTGSGSICIYQEDKESKHIHDRLLTSGKDGAEYFLI